MNGWSPSVTHDGIGVRQCGDAAAQREPLALVPVLADDDLGLAEVDAMEDLGRGVAEHDQHRVEGRDGEHGLDRVLEQRTTAQVGELLGAAEAPARRRRRG